MRILAAILDSNLGFVLLSCHLARPKASEEELRPDLFFSICCSICASVLPGKGKGAEYASGAILSLRWV